MSEDSFTEETERRFGRRSYEFSANAAEPMREPSPRPSSDVVEYGGSPQDEQSPKEESHRRSSLVSKSFRLRAPPPLLPDFTGVGSVAKPKRNFTVQSSGGLFAPSQARQNEPKCVLFRVNDPTVGAIKWFFSQQHEVRVPSRKAVGFRHTFVFVKMGKDEAQQIFALHKKILAGRCQHFKDLLSELAVPENNSLKIIDLLEHDPSVFTLYVQLLYTGRIPSEAASSDEHSLLCKLYVFAHSIMDVEVQNASLDAIYAIATALSSPPETQLPRSEHVNVIYKGTTGPCGGRRLMVDLYTGRAKESLLHNASEFPVEIMNELVVSLLRVREQALVGVVSSKEEYHEGNIAG